MLPLRKRLDYVVKKTGRRLDVLQQDYLLSWALIAILQHTKKMHERDWSRSRARDYYDLWSIFHTFHERLNLTDLARLLKQKCDHKEVSFRDGDSFFDDKMLAHVKQTWNQWLGPLVSNLPTYETVITTLRPKIVALLNEKK